MTAATAFVVLRRTSLSLMTISSLTQRVSARNLFQNSRAPISAFPILAVSPDLLGDFNKDLVIERRDSGLGVFMRLAEDTPRLTAQVCGTVSEGRFWSRGGVVVVYLSGKGRCGVSTAPFYFTEWP